MQQLFNEMIKQDVKPLLSKHGFAKKGFNFSRAAGSLVYIINFQKSGGNSAGNIMFYVNCGIYAAELAQLQSGRTLEAPKEVDCHFRSRIEEIAGSVPDRFAITPDTDMADLRKTLLNGLEEVLHFFGTMTSARAIVDYYVAGPYLHLSEESFHMLLEANDIAAAKAYYRALREKHGSENRWSIFERKYEAIFNKHGIADVSTSE